jgi:hypothetical protein
LPLFNGVAKQTILGLKKYLGEAFASLTYGLQFYVAVFCLPFFAMFIRKFFLTSLKRVIIEKLTFFQIVKKLSKFRGT